MNYPDSFHSIYGSDESRHVLPKDCLNNHSIDEEIAYQLILDELQHDGNPRHNLATFVQTYMEPKATQLMIDTLSVNAVDQTEYPQTVRIENYCVDIIANLWNAPDKNYIGSATLGSSEACMLAGIAMIFHWRRQAKKYNIPTGKLNLIVSSCIQVVWEKFSIFWDIDLKVVPVKDLNNLRLNPQEAVNLIDDYTIGIVSILGITYTGLFDDIKELDHLVEQYNQSNNMQVYIHIDAASGGLFTPFIDPELEWDFRLKNVISINTSGHKYGLVYPGIGWILWKNKDFLDPKLMFSVDYLGVSFNPQFQLNFSRSASAIWTQYYNFVRFGKEGYKKLHSNTKYIAQHMAKFLKSTGLFHIISDGSDIPVVSWTLKEKKNWTLFDLSEELEKKGWKIPTYHLPANLTDQIITRIVFRADFSMEQLSLLIEDFENVIPVLNTRTYQTPQQTKNFNH